MTRFLWEIFGTKVEINLTRAEYNWLKKTSASTGLSYSRLLLNVVRQRVWDDADAVRAVHLGKPGEAQR